MGAASAVRRCVSNIFLLNNRRQNRRQYAKFEIFLFREIYSVLKELKMILSCLGSDSYFNLVIVIILNL